MPDHESQPRSFVLLTGSTGLVGGLVLARLLACQIPVAVLVRGNRRQTATERIEAVMGRLEERFGKLFVRPVVLDGDLCQPGLGLSETDRRWIAANCGSVIHSAANLLFRPASEHPDNEPYRTNVDGTRHLLEVATAARINEWHYVSTAYVAGLRDGRILEQECNVGQQFGNDYERSKVMAEDMVRTSPAIRSLTVYRPSIVIDLHPTTSMRSDQTINSAFVMFQTLSKQFGLPERGEWFLRLGFGGEERKNIVTVDWVAAMIAEIYRRPALHGSTYHLTSPTGTSASTLEDGFRAAVQSSSMKLPPRRAEATALIDEHAAPFVAAFKPYFKDDPKFDRANTVLAMEACREADLEELTIEKLRDFCIRQTKPPAQIPAIGSARSAWTTFIGRAENREVSIDSQSLDRSSFVGLEVSGPGGGQWLIEITANNLKMHVRAAKAAAVRWLTTANTMNHLLDGGLPVENALTNGLLVIENDAVSLNSTPEFLATATQSHLNQLSNLIAAFHDHSRDHLARSSEVTHVG
jgi:thioester reductase-like protein